MKENAFFSVVERIKKIESEFGSLEDYVILTNFGKKHKMRMKGVTLSDFQNMESVDLSDLTYADLVDENKFVGRFDGKFD